MRLDTSIGFEVLIRNQTMFLILSNGGRDT